MRSFSATGPEIPESRAGTLHPTCRGEAGLPLVPWCHAVLAVKAFAREDARSRSAAEDRGGLDGCAAACRFLTRAIPPQATKRRRMVLIPPSGAWPQSLSEVDDHG